MPSVFNHLTTTPRRVRDPLGDQKMPSGGGLNWSSITSDSALLGTTGTDCQKIAGHRWREVNGDLTENYSGDKKIDVKGKHTEKIVGNRTITVTAGNVERNVSAGKVTDKIAQSHDEQVGASYSLRAVKQDFQASALISINGALVKINT